MSLKVKQFHSDSEFIRAPADCVFYRNQTYSCHSDPEGFLIQPSKARLSANYGPNYHPVFCLDLPLRPEEVTVIIKDQQDQEIWKYRHFLSGIEEQEQRNRSFHKEKLQQIRPEFIKKVSDPTLDNLLDKLRQYEVITRSEEENMRAANSRSERARLLLDTVTNKGERASSYLMTTLKGEDNFLSVELGLMRH